MDVVINSDCSFSPDPKSLLNGYSNYHLNIFKCLDYPDEQIPLASLLSSHHSLHGQWLVVTPIFWQASHNNAVILACDAKLNLLEEEARELFDKFSIFAKESGMQAYFHDRYTWLLECDGKPSTQSIPPHRLLHQPIFPHLKNMDSTLYWQRFITEIQMLFIDQKKVNGVWLWGNGDLHNPVNRCILVNDSKTHALAQLLSQRVNYFAHSKPTKKALLLLDSMNQEEENLLRAKLSHLHVNWYWNNVAYSSRPQSWFSRWIKRVS